MGNSNTKKTKKVPDKFFERERMKEQKREALKKKKMNPANKRTAAKEGPLGTAGPPPPPAPPGPASPPQQRTYHSEALARMRYQLDEDADAFLLNNILLSVQFFENYEREVQHIKNNPINEREHEIDQAMVAHHKHVFFADRVRESVHERVRVRGRAGLEPLSAPRLYVIYDNIEACERGDTSDYSAVLDAPFYKLEVEDCREAGFIKLKKLEVLESEATKIKEVALENTRNSLSEDSFFTDSERESYDTDDDPSDIVSGQVLLEKLKNKLADPRKDNFKIRKPLNMKLNSPTDTPGRRRSGPIRQYSPQANKSNISNIKEISKHKSPVLEEKEETLLADDNHNDQAESKATKSILKSSGSKQSNVSLTQIYSNGSDDTETSGYRSNSSSRQNESETESEYGYATITESATPKPIELSIKSNISANTGVLPDECWSLMRVQAVDSVSDEEEEDDDDDESRKDSNELEVKSLYENYYYLNSITFMTNFVDNFMLKLKSGLGVSEESIDNALTQGASIYCECVKKDINMSFEIIPALLAAWPNAANQWIIRERRIIQNPRTNIKYQWPTRYMVNKAVGFGCLLVPVGFRPKRGSNPDQRLQWKISFPAAERYLESCLAHAQMRCYLFALALHKSFLENESTKIGIDASHIKNHLFWQCEADYSKWPEDRLGETLRIFLQTFYAHFAQAKFPNYFIEQCNDFKSIPQPLLLKLQRKLADILEAPVMHVLSAVGKLKYMKKDFYPKFNSQKLYYILTCKNPLRVINPNIPVANTNDSTDDDEDPDAGTNIWERAKKHDKHYQWKIKQQQQKQVEKRKAALLQSKKQKASKPTGIHINPKVMLPKKLDVERRRLVLEFFIPHFIAMARSSERFESIRQALIYLEHAQLLCHLLLDEAAGEMTANEYLDVIRDKLADCQRKLVNQGGFNLPERKERPVSRNNLPVRKQRPRYPNIVNQDSPTDLRTSSFTFVDVHAAGPSSPNRRASRFNINFENDFDDEEESKL
ncbi:unnamed protein product [Plutella xylostella]|uniref:(diamondback moth) hypothetical protein n=1 Tax=Plutella xylostella TaxID=51655 RepID=A0A8S4DFZ9_PLUXY|nr:unnamed protein product [Plutella xylostella]